MAKYTAIGGQALIEGIMMKSPEKTAMAVRKPDNTIEIVNVQWKSLRDKYSFFRLPVIRGVVSYIESMVQGYKLMMQSADISGFTELNEEITDEKDKKKASALVNAVMAIGSVLGVLLAVVLFLAVPRLAVSGIEWAFKTEINNELVRSGIEQLIKLCVLVAYMWGVSFMSDIRRVFSYHGAEHKTIFCYEKGLPLTVENVKQQKRFHPRCGTSFLILMIIVSVIVSTVIQMIFPTVYDIAWLWVIVKILMLPIICGLGFEVLRACGKYDNVLTRIISAPGMWMQRITTKEPDDSMIEIAIAALKACEPSVPDVDRSVDKEKSDE